jgi:hypothetical protein
VNLISQQVDLVMSISVDVLAGHIKQLRGLSRPGQVIEVPFRGKIGDVGMDLDHLKAQIARLAGTMLLLEGLGEDGRVIGNILGDLLGDDSRRRPPRASPEDKKQTQSPKLDRIPDEEGENTGKGQGVDRRRDNSDDPIVNLWRVLQKDLEEKQRLKKNRKKKKETDREDI